MASSFRRIPLLLIVCGLALSGGTASADVSKEAGAPPAGESAAQLNEVAIIGKKLRQLKREAIEAEDRFFEHFNALNTKDDFDIHCRMDKATGTRVPKRQCRIQFLADAAAIDGEEFYRGLFNGRGVNTPDAALLPLWLQRREEYRQTARALLEKNPQLLALATEWVRLREHYDRARK